LTARRDQLCAKDNALVWGADGTSERRRPTKRAAYSAAIVWGLKAMPSAFATPAPYSGSAL
jgi:hypothetical protein